MKSKPLDILELTDEGNARRFVELHGPSIRFCPSWGWIVYDGQQWRKSDMIAIERKGRDTFQWLSDESRRIKDSLDRHKYQAALKGYKSARALNGMLSLARSDAKISVMTGDFDRDPFLLNCRNGTISLKTGELGPHDPGDYLSKSTAVDFIPQASCPQWDAYVRQITGEDAELIGYLRRAAGYALTGDTGEQCLFLLYGNGSNGKSVFLETILSLLDDYGMKAQPHLLTAEGHSKHSTSIADLEGRRFVAISEPSGGRFDAAQLKALIGDETIRANRMHCDSHQFNATHKFFMASNHKPVATEGGLAFWRRIRLIEFGVTIRPEEEDRHLLEKLREEAPGILNWMIQGCLEWQANPAGLAVPVKVSQATSDYRDEMDPLAEFVAACCVQGPEHRVRSSELWMAYKQWCDEQEISQSDRIGNDTRFGTLLTQKGFIAKKTGGTMVRLGIGLKVNPKEEAFRDDAVHG